MRAAEHVHGLHGLPFGEPGARVERQADVSGLDLTPSSHPRLLNS